MKASDRDQQFLQHAARDGLAEIQVGQMVVERATNPEVLVKDHEKAVQLFSTEAQEGKDADIKAFASKTLPTLQEGVPAVLEQKTTMCCNYLSLHRLAIVSVPKKARRRPVYWTSTPLTHLIDVAYPFFGLDHGTGHSAPSILPCGSPWWTQRCWG